ncbi:MAG: NADPH:quinone oxidoreductase family protein [Edaphobacter sp.]|nr:NADPH:quinone oxidoreductase family protein [Edaphobacter sp.]
MKAIQLHGFEGPGSARLVDIDRPKRGANEILIEVKASGINYADALQTYGKYPTFGKEVPFTLGFEAAGIVRELGPGVTNVKIGDPVAAAVSSGGYAEYALAAGAAVIPLPSGLSFAEAAALPIQGMSAYTMLKYAVMPVAPSSVLVQAAAGGVGLFLVQLARHFGIGKVIALASSSEKLQLAKTLGADESINYTEADWPDQVRRATDGRGVDVVLQMSTGQVGKESFKLAAQGGRIVIFGAENYHDSINTEQVRQLIWQNQTIAGFAFPALSPIQIAESQPLFMDLVRAGKLRILAEHVFPLADAAVAIEMLLSRKTMGKVVLRP